MESSGEQTAKDLLVAQKSFLPHDPFMGEQWLADYGLITETLADTLIGYGYMQRGVGNVKLTVDFDEANQGVSPSVTYELKLKPGAAFRYRLITTCLNQGGFWGRLLAVLLLKFGTPFPGSIEGNIVHLVRGVLPKRYTVKVNVV